MYLGNFRSNLFHEELYISMIFGNWKKQKLGNECVSLLLWTQCAKRRSRGPSRNHTITDVRSAIIVPLYFSIATGVGSLELTAKSVRPREKSFISAISRFQYEALKKNMNDVRGQEMSENTLLSFVIFPKISFLRFAENLRGGWKKWPISACAHSTRGPTLKIFFNSKFGGYFFFRKNRFF